MADSYGFENNMLKLFQPALEEYNRKFKQSIPALKSLQEDTLQYLLAGEDTFCCLPTGYGKSVIYELLPFLDKGCLVITVVPLNAIMEQGVQKLAGDAFPISSGKTYLNKLKLNDFHYIFAHPEQLINNKSVNEALQFIGEKRKIYLVIDEAHCILDWGQDFRPDYAQIYQLRSVVECTVLALSATVTEQGRAQISKNLQMRSYRTVTGSPAKDNIVLIVEKRPSPTAKGNSAVTPYDYIFKPLIEVLKDKLNSFPITIIYCKSSNWLGYGYEMARRLLGAHFYSGEQSSENARVAMYHAKMEKDYGQLKNLIISSLRKPAEECPLKLLFASVALGMGADLRNVQRVIHAGLPTCLETYIQEIGRAGRSECSAEAILYYNNNDIAQPSMRSDIKTYCTSSDKCRREVINEHFGFKTEVKPDKCCNICHSQLGLAYDFSKLSL